MDIGDLFNEWVTNDLTDRTFEEFLEDRQKFIDKKTAAVRRSGLFAFDRQVYTIDIEKERAYCMVCRVWLSRVEVMEHIHGDDRGQTHSTGT